MLLKGMTIGLLLGITVWFLLVRRLQDKPWTQHGILPASQEKLGSAQRVGLFAFLAMVTSLFLIFNSAYLMRMNDTHGALSAWVPVDEPRILWLNTLLLFLASVTMQLARNFAAKDELLRVRNFYTAAGVLTIAFLCGQLLAWRQLYATGKYSASDAAFAFFILLTAVHGLHLLGGLVVHARTTARIWNAIGKAGVVQTARLRQSVQLCTTYWHFLLIVWLGLFWLLSAT